MQGTCFAWRPGLRLHSQEPKLVPLSGVLSETFAPSVRLPLLPQVAEFQERVAAQSQEQAILQRSLEDKAAQVEVERMGAKVRVCRSQGLREAWEPRSMGQGPGEGTLPFIVSFTVPAGGAEPCPGSPAPGAAADSLG